MTLDSTSLWQKKWVLGNWKMNGRFDMIVQRLPEIIPDILPSHVVTGLALPNTYLLQAQPILLRKKALCGAEDVSRFADDGAYTGEVSAQMLADCGVNFALIGHSERRQYFQEANEILGQKLQNIINANIIPILCVGEELSDRQKGQEFDVITQQLSVLERVSHLSGLVVAYEPVWAIGTGEVATLEQIERMHTFIYNRILSIYSESVNIRVLYGGSVKPSNAQGILSTRYVDGALVGGCSLDATDFTQIIQQA